MCLPKEAVKSRTPPRSPWRRLRLLKPKLSRKVVPGARVNLNNFWSKFEDLYDVNRSADLLNDNEINENILNELSN